MPVQINEMIIRATVTEPDKNAEVKGDEKGSGNVDKEEMIKECAELVMEMISKKYER
jgi:hypothetical protein